MISRARPSGNRICLASVQRALTSQRAALSCAAFLHLR
ncbi:MAG TPA: sugar ABC transporter ATPase, partial [Pseudomonas sp.]|nr:sugar ABC transporter ATPase [Pseudomonas sp.]